MSASLWSTTGQGTPRTPPWSLSGPTRTGYALITLVLVTVLGWGVFAEIAGAVLASGRVAVESGPKRIQHKDGGVVSAVLVREGERVKSGQVLARLDATTVGAQNAVLDNQIAQARMRKARLEAEISGTWRLDLPPGETPTRELRIHLEGERSLLRQQRLLREQARAQLKEQIRQALQEIDALESQRTAYTEQLRLKNRELESLRQTQVDGYMTRNALSVHEREAERLAGDRGEVAAAVARARSQVSALNTQLLHVDAEAQRLAMAELSDVTTRLGSLVQQSIAARETLRRVELQAPVDGVVQQLAVHTKDGVLAPGQVLMVVVPERDELIVEAMIDPRRIDQVHIGARAYVRFTAFDANTTPEALAVVDSLTSDIELDEKTGASYYRARLGLDRSSLPPLLQRKLMAGMTADVQIETVKRSAISYLMKPLTDHLRRAFADD